MSVIGSNILAGASGQAGYNLTKSLRFRRSASGYLNRTPASAGNRKTWTWSAWVKLGSLDVTRQIFGTGAGATHAALVFEAGNTLFAFSADAGQTFLRTSQVFRDPSAWYHVVWAEDTTQATASNRSKLYVNGVQITAFSTANYPSPDFQGGINNNVAQFISSYDGSTWLYDGYMTEINFIDGQQLTPSSFGQTSTTTGVWQPKKYTGTYGTNGFYLPFTDTTSTSTLGTDFSGNSNTWTVNNISLTSGSTYDSMNDVPTLTSATTANYATLNPLAKASQGTMSNGNLRALTTGSASIVAPATMQLTGNTYWEYVSVGNNNAIAGLIFGDLPNVGSSWFPSTSSYAMFASGSALYTQNSTASQSATPSWASGNTLGLAWDNSARTLTLYVNNTLSSVMTITSPTTQPYPVFANYSSTPVTDIEANFGQRPFAYTPPTGFVALNTFNLPTPTIGATASTQAGKYFNPVLWTGNGSTPRSFTGIGFAPDFAWIKSRSTAADHALIDSVRGTGSKALSSNTTGAENGDGLVINSFDSDGYTLATGSINFSYANTNTASYVSWNWKANGTAVTNTAGSITSTVSANTTAGFSIVTYTGNGTNGATVGHGLGAKPFLIIEKGRTSTFAWSVQGCGELWTPVTSNLFLSGTNSLNANGAVAAPTSTVYTPSAVAYANESGITNIAYCFAPVAGYSAMGSYTGNGSTDGVFVYTGFRPRYLMIKRTDSSNNWVIQDTSRDTYNVSEKDLYADTSGAEATYAAEKTDILSNGFKQRQTGASMNASGGTYIYMAFAENPFKYANAR